MDKSINHKCTAKMIFCIMLFVFGSSMTMRECFAEEQSSSENNFFDMSLEELVDVEIVSASRQKQSLEDVSMPVSVITAEDIHYSGLTNIPEILQFAPGVDMLKLSRFRYAAGVRGLHEFISDRTLVLINGRAAESPLFGGAEYYTLPILMEDIDRIEIVRGPGGAAWGANAFNGVINIITKKPEDVSGVFGSTTMSEFGDSYTHMRYAGKKDKWGWRISVGYEDLEDSEEVGAGKYESRQTAGVNSLMGFSGFTANDFMRNWRFDTEAFCDYSDRTQVSFGVAHSHAEVGDWEFGGYYPGGNGWYETNRSFAKLEHEFENGSTGYLQWFGNYANSKVPTLMKWDWMQNDIEGQLNFKFTDAHEATIGGNVRFIRLDTHSELATEQQLTYPGSPFDEQFLGAFLIDRWSLSDRFSLEGQIRTDYYSETQTDWATRLAALYAIDKQRDHVVRFGFAKAFRTPFTSPTRCLTSRIPLPSPPYPSGLYAFNVIPADDLDNEETSSLELGYTGKLDRNLILRTDAYYQRYSKLIGYTKVYDAYGLPYHKAKNIDGADSWGAEVELALQDKKRKISVWYAYNDFQEDTSQQGIRSYLPAQHKMGLTGRLFLADGWTFNANYKYANSTRTLDLDTTIFDVGSSHRLDLSLAKTFAKGNGEIMTGVSDVLNKINGPNFGIGQLSAHETPGRTWFTRISLRF